MSSAEIMLQGNESDMVYVVHGLREFTETTPGIQMDVSHTNDYHIILRGDRATIYGALSTLHGRLSQVPKVQLITHGPSGDDEDDLTFTEKAHVAGLIYGTSCL